MRLPKINTQILVEIFMHKISIKLNHNIKNLPGLNILSI